VQIGAADGAGGETHDGVRGVLDLGLVNIIEPDITDAVENDCFHDRSSLMNYSVRKSADSRGLSSGLGTFGIPCHILLLACPGMDLIGAL
jgi:hypothetical protein